MKKVKVAIVGPRNIGTDLLYKSRRSPFVQLEYGRNWTILLHADRPNG